MDIPSKYHGSIVKVSEDFQLMFEITPGKISYMEDELLLGKGEGCYAFISSEKNPENSTTIELVVGTPPEIAPPSENDVRFELYRVVDKLTKEALDAKLTSMNIQQSLPKEKEKPKFIKPKISSEQFEPTSFAISSGTFTIQHDTNEEYNMGSDLVATLDELQLCPNIAYAMISSFKLDLFKSIVSDIVVKGNAQSPTEQFIKDMKARRISQEQASKSFNALMEYLEPLMEDNCSDCPDNDVCSFKKP